jgi:hypothetical protein
VNTREELIEYDPGLAALLKEVFGDNAWRYIKPEKRKEMPAHLKGYDFSSGKVFRWRNASQTR